MMECNCLLVVRAKRPCKEYHYSPWMGASASQVSPQTARFLQQIPPPQIYILLEKQRHSVSVLPRNTTQSPKSVLELAA